MFADDGVAIHAGVNSRLQIAKRDDPLSVDKDDMVWNKIEQRRQKRLPLFQTVRRDTSQYPTAIWLPFQGTAEWCEGAAGRRRAFFSMAIPLS